MSLYNWYDLQLTRKTKEDEKIKEALRKDQSIIRVTLDWIVNGAIPPEPLGQLGVSPTDLLAPRVYWVKDKAVFDHPATLPIAARAYLLDFWVNQKDLHKELRECPACGRFFWGFEKTKKNIYCGTECKSRFLERSREEDRERKQNERDELRKLIKHVEKAREEKEAGSAERQRQEENERTLKRKRKDEKYRKYLSERQKQKAFTSEQEKVRLEKYFKENKSYDDVLIQRILDVYPLDEGWTLEKILPELDKLKKETPFQRKSTAD